MKNTTNLTATEAKGQDVAHRSDDKGTAVPNSAAERPQAGVAGAPGRFDGRRM